MAHFAKRGQIQAGGGFIKEQGSGIVNERAGDEETAGFAGREFVEPAIGKVSDFEAGQGCGRGGFHFRQNKMVGPDADGAEEARENEFAAFDIASALSHEVVGDETDLMAKLKDVPLTSSKNAERRFGAKERIAFAGESFDECGFATAVLGREWQRAHPL